MAKNSNLVWNKFCRGHSTANAKTMHFQFCHAKVRTKVVVVVMSVLEIAVTVASSEAERDSGSTPYERTISSIAASKPTLGMMRPTANKNLKQSTKIYCKHVQFWHTWQPFHNWPMIWSFLPIPKQWSQNLLGRSPYCVYSDTGCPFFSLWIAKYVTD